MRDRIHRAALTCFMEYGVAGTTMAQIISTSGLSAGAIYGYYPSKAELTRAVADTVLTIRREQIRSLTQHDPLPPPVEVLSTLIETFPADVLESSLILQFWGHAHQDSALRALTSTVTRGLQEETVDYLTRWLVESGVPRPRANQRAAAVFPAVLALLQGYLVQSAVGEPVSTGDYLAAVRLLLDGLLSE